MSQDIIVKSMNVIQKAFSKFDKVGLSYSTGKDSTLCLHLMRELAAEFPVIFTDTTAHFKETYDFLQEESKRLDLDLHIAVSDKPMVTELIENRMICCNHHKTIPFLEKVKELELDAVIIGTRWDEHSSRSGEKYFRKFKDHVRVHPILHWSESDVWDYIHDHNIPYNPLYYRGYRSIGCQPCTEPSGLDERSGRDQDKEEILDYLRRLGYF